MSVYDFLSLQNMNKNWSSLLVGSYSVALGDTLTAFIGSGRQTHIVGDEIKYVFDWVRCLEEVPLLKSLLAVLPVTALLGEGGNMTWTFGRQTNLNYVGPVIAIKRAGSKAVTSRGNFFAPDKPPKDYTGTAEEWEAKEKVAKWSGVIVALLSAAMLAVNTGVEIAARIKYQTGYNKYKTTPSTSDRESFEQMTTYCSVTLILTTRMMYLIKSLELITATAQNAISEFFKAGWVAKETATATITAAVSNAIFEDIIERLKNAKKAVTDFLLEMGKLLLALVFIMALVVIGLAIAAGATGNNSLFFGAS